MGPLQQQLCGLLHQPSGPEGFRTFAATEGLEESTLREHQAMLDAWGRPDPGLGFRRALWHLPVIPGAVGKGQPSHNLVVYSTAQADGGLLHHLLRFEAGLYPAFGCSPFPLLEARLLLTRFAPGQSFPRILDALPEVVEPRIRRIFPEQYPLLKALLTRLLATGRLHIPVAGDSQAGELLVEQILELLPLPVRAQLAFSTFAPAGAGNYDMALVLDRSADLGASLTHLLVPSGTALDDRDAEYLELLFEAMRSRDWDSAEEIIYGSTGRPSVRGDDSGMTPPLAPRPRELPTGSGRPDWAPASTTSEAPDPGTTPDWSPMSAVRKAVTPEFRQGRGDGPLPTHRPAPVEREPEVQPRPQAFPGGGPEYVREHDSYEARTRPPLRRPGMIGLVVLVVVLVGAGVLWWRADWRTGGFTGGVDFGGAPEVEESPAVDGSRVDATVADRFGIARILDRAIAEHVLAAPESGMPVPPLDPAAVDLAFSAELRQIDEAVRQARDPVAALREQAIGLQRRAAQLGWWQEAAGLPASEFLDRLGAGTGADSVPVSASPNARVSGWATAADSAAGALEALYALEWPPRAGDWDTAEAALERVRQDFTGLGPPPAILGAAARLIGPVSQWVIQATAPSIRQAALRASPGEGFYGPASVHRSIVEAAVGLREATGSLPACLERGADWSAAARLLVASADRHGARLALAALDQLTSDPDFVGVLKSPARDWFVRALLEARIRLASPDPTEVREGNDAFLGEAAQESRIAAADLAVARATTPGDAAVVDRLRLRLPSLREPVHRELYRAWLASVPARSSSAGTPDAQVVADPGPGTTEASDPLLSAVERYGATPDAASRAELLRMANQDEGNTGAGLRAELRGDREVRLTHFVFEIADGFPVDRGGEILDLELVLARVGGDPVGPGIPVSAFPWPEVDQSGRHEGSVDLEFTLPVLGEIEVFVRDRSGAAIRVRRVVAATGDRDLPALLRGPFEFTAAGRVVARLSLEFDPGWREAEANGLSALLPGAN